MSAGGPGERAVEGTGLVLVWDRGRGDPVLVERTPAVDEGEAAALQDAAARFAEVRSPHLLRPRSVVVEGDQTVVVLDAGPVRSLSSLLARRAVLDAGEVVTVGVAVARALTAAHSDDLLLGRLHASQVLLRDDGMPVLVVGASALHASSRDASTRPASARQAAAQLAPPDSAAGRAEDVGALAALCTSMLGPQPPPALVEVLERAGAPDLARRPDAVVLGALLSRACPPAPVRWTAAAPTPEPTPEHGSARAGPRLPGRVLLALAALVVVAAVLGWMSGGGGEARPAPPAPRWSVVLDRLDATRAAAFAEADEAALQEVYVPAAAALSVDRARVRALAAAGRTAHEVRHGLRDVEVLHVEPERVRLRVTDVLAAYEVRDARGAVVGTAPGRGEAVSVVELRRTPGGWRLLEVVPDP